MNSPLDATPVVGFDSAYQAVIQALEEGVILYDFQGAVLTCNPAAERALGLSLAQMQGRTAPWTRAGTPSTRTACHLRARAAPSSLCLQTGRAADDGNGGASA